MSLAEVKVLYESNASQVPETLEKNAQLIRSGEYGECKSAVLVLLGEENGREKIIVCGLGESEYWKSIGILQGGIHYLQKMIPE